MRSVFAQTNNIYFDRKLYCKTVFVLTIVCLAIGSMTRVYYCLKYPVPVRDSFLYAELIQKWNETGVIPADKSVPPLSLFLLNIPSSLAQIDIIHGAICINVVIGLLLILISIQISLHISKSILAAFGIGVITATHPTMIYYSCQALKENPYLLFSGLYFLALIMFFKSTEIKPLLLCSVCSCAAYLCRHEGIEFLFLTFFLLLFMRRKMSFSKIIKCCVLFFVTFVLSFAIISRALGVSADYYYNYVEKATYLKH